ncbi:MAG TPA: hypothetical protein VF630_03995 [Hymenobacter sp.]|jgi:hypothetical protein
MANNSYPRLANIFSLDQLPTGLQVLQPTANVVQDVLEKVHYRNLMVKQGNSAFAWAASLEIVSYQPLRVGACASGFTLVLNPEELAANGVTTFPVAFSFSLGIRKFLPLLNLRSPPTSADALFTLLCNITGVTDSELLNQAIMAFETV